MTTLSALWGLREEDSHEFEASLGYIARPCLNPPIHKLGSLDISANSRKGLSIEEVLSWL